MKRGWEVVYFDKTVVNENQLDWKAVKKNQIDTLTLHYDGREWNLYGKEAYLQKKRASMAPGVPESFTVEPRSIGYYEGNKKVWYTVDEWTGRMEMKVEG